MNTEDFKLKIKKAYEMEALLEKLGVRVDVAATGTIYVYHNDKKIRISDHEPNFAMKRFRSEADLEIYTRDACNQIINDKYDVVEKVADFLNIEIKESLKATLTKAENKKYAEELRILKIQREHEIYMKEVDRKREEHYEKIKENIKSKEDLLIKMIFDAETYGDLGSNRSSRRRRRSNYFRNEFQKEFGFNAEISEVKDIIASKRPWGKLWLYKIINEEKRKDEDK